MGTGQRVQQADDRIEIVFVYGNDKRFAVQAQIGQSVMEAAVANNVPGIGAICGGAMICATCRVFADPVWPPEVGLPGQYERDVLESITTGPAEGARLSCQVNVCRSLVGTVLHIPKIQDSR
jgi:2Fe-2S ferredoxin